MGITVTLLQLLVHFFTFLLIFFPAEGLGRAPAVRMPATPDTISPLFDQNDFPAPYVTSCYTSLRPTTALLYPSLDLAVYADGYTVFHQLALCPAWSNFPFPLATMDALYALPTFSGPSWAPLDAPTAPPLDLMLFYDSSLSDVLTQAFINRYQHTKTYTPHLILKPVSPTIPNTATDPLQLQAHVKTLAPIIAHFAPKKDSILHQVSRKILQWRLNTASTDQSDDLSSLPAEPASSATLPPATPPDDDSQRPTAPTSTVQEVMPDNDLYVNETSSDQDEFDSDWIPPGFTDLPDEEISELAVYYDGTFLKNVVAEFDTQVVRLFNSEVLHPLLTPYLSDSEVVFNKLSQTLPANSDLACKNRRLGNTCPYLSPKIVGFILDRNNYRLDLFIAPEYLLYSSNDTAIVYSHPSSNEWSYSSRISSSLSGDLRQIVANVINDQYLSRGPYNLYMNLSYNHNIDYEDSDSSYVGDFFLNNLNGNYENKRRHYMFGFIPAAGTQYTASGNIFGYGLKTIDRLMKGQEGLVGTPIDITISVPSLVTYYVNNQIIYSRRYPTGVHAVDTNAFPNGSYMIRAVIEDINGDSSTQSFPFSKSTTDPIMGYPEYAFYLGMNRGETAEIYPKITGDFFATWNYAYRYSPKLALYFESGWQDNAFTLGFGPGFYWRKRQYIRPSIAYDTKAGILYSITTQNYWKTISATLHASRVKDDVYDSNELYSANVQWNLKRYGSISMNYNNTDSFTYIYNARRQFTFPKSWKDPFKFSLQIGHGSDGTFLRLGTTKTLYKDQHQKAMFTNNVNHDTSAGPMTSASNLAYIFGTNYSPTVKIGASANVGEESLSLNTTLAKRIRNNIIRLQGSLQQPYDGDLTFVYDVNLSRKDAFGWVINKDSSTFLGNMEHSTGALVTVDGMANNKDLVVSALGKEYRVDAQGQSAFIPLEPYRPHQIMIDYRGTQAFSFSGIGQPVVLFPGNIAFINVVAQPVYTLFASFACGDQPFAYKAVYSSVDSAVTDADGFASLEIAHDDVLRVYGKGNESVTFNTSNLMPEDGFLYMDELSCSTGADIMNAAAKKSDETMDFTNTPNTDPSPTSPDSTSAAKRSPADKEDDMASDGTDLNTIDSASTTQPAPAVTADN